MSRSGFFHKLMHRNFSSDLDSSREALTAGLDIEPTNSPKAKNGLGIFSQKETYWGINRYGMHDQFKLYFNDLFHTLLNMPRNRFILVFFAVYILQYMFFAFIYISQPNTCVTGIKKFSHAMWFSVQTAATIGYGGLAPDPSCTVTNLMVMIQVICSALVDYSMLGIVFARFAAPNKRSRTIRFSVSAVMHYMDNGVWCLMFRVANVRKHPILAPKVQILLTTPEDDTGTTFKFEELSVENEKSQEANLKLGLPVVVTHFVTPTSPLWGVSLETLAGRNAELLVFLDGTDAMTSNSLQARHAYNMSDIKMNERFTNLHLTSNNGRVGLDFSTFDHTTTDEASTNYFTVHVASPDAPEPPQHGSPLSALTPRPRLLRSLTFREHTERSRATHPGSSTSSLGPSREQEHAAHLQALCSAVLNNPVCSDDLKRLALAVRSTQPDK